MSIDTGIAQNPPHRRNNKYSFEYLFPGADKAPLRVLLKPVVVMTGTEDSCIGGNIESSLE